jgi:hypothetical protein
LLLHVRLFLGYSLRGSQEALRASWSSGIGIHAALRRGQRYLHMELLGRFVRFTSRAFVHKVCIGLWNLHHTAWRCNWLALMQRLGMQRHLRLCLGLRLSQQAEGYVGIMELIDPGAGGFMENG